MLLKMMENNSVPDTFSAIHYPKWFQNNFQLLHSTDQLLSRKECTAIAAILSTTPTSKFI